MRKLWVVALANLAVIGLVLTAIITNVVSACSSADGCGSAPPYIYVGLVLVLLGCAGLFLLFRKWRGAAAATASTTDKESASDELAPKRQRSNKASRAEQRDADAEAETSSRSRLGRIRGLASEAVADEPDAMGDKEFRTIAASAADGDADGDDELWAVDSESDADNAATAMAGGLDVVATSPVGTGDMEMDVVAADDDDLADAWPVDDMPAISPSKDQLEQFFSEPSEPAVTLPLMADHSDNGAETAVSGHISLDQIFAGPSALPGVTDDAEPASVKPAEPVLAAPPQNFDACVPAGFPATVADLRALIGVLSLDILLDKQARDDIAAWNAVLAPLDNADAVGPEDCEAFAQWIDALAERHNADLATTVAHALEQRGGGHDPYRSAA